MSVFRCRDVATISEVTIMAIPLLGPLIGLGTKLLEGRQASKRVEQEATKAWESAVGRSMENGWKDEYVTVVITLPILNIFIGNLLSVWKPALGTAVLEANSKAMVQIGSLMDSAYGQVMMIVVLAAVGIKTIKTLK